MVRIYMDLRSEKKRTATKRGRGLAIENRHVSKDFKVMSMTYINHILELRRCVNKYYNSSINKMNKPKENPTCMWDLGVFRESSRIS